MLRFTPLDALAVALYLGSVVGIGLFMRLRKTSSEEYFLGGRRFGRVVHLFASFGQVTTADGPVGVATATFHNGISGVWTSLNMLFSTPLLWIVAPWLRRLRVMTMADFYVERYGSRRLAAAYAAIAAVGMMSVLSAGYLALAKTAIALTGISAPPALLIWAICGVALLNALFGGLAAAYHSAVIQGVLVIFISIVLIPFGFAQLNADTGGSGMLGAFATLHARLPRHFFNVFGSSELPDFSWIYIVCVAAVAGLSNVTQPNLLVTCAAARSESVARFGIVAGTLTKRICTIFWALSGLIAVALFGESLRDSDLVWGYAARALLAPLGAGLVGLMLAGMLAAFTATSNSLMLSMAGLMTQNIYRYLRPWDPETRYIAVGRIAGALFLCGGAFIASQFGSLFALLKLNWEFFVVFTAAFWMGLKWRRANRAAAWASILAPFVFFYALPVGLATCSPRLHTSPNLSLLVERQPLPSAVGATAPSIFWSEGVVRDSSGRLVGRGYPYFDLLALQCAGFDLRHRSNSQNETLRLLLRLAFPFAILYAVARATTPDHPAIARQFFDRMRIRISDTDEQGNGTVELLCPDSEWEFYRWDRHDALGFLATIGFVVAIIGLLAALMTLGC